MNEHIDEVDQLQYWASLYEKAQEDGVFEPLPKPHTPSQHNSEVDFFGQVTTNHDTSLNDVDGQYWDVVHKLSKEMGGDYVDPFSSEAAQVLNEDLKKPEDLAVAVKQIGGSANPIRHSSVGKDQDLSPEPLGQTFTNDDLEEIAKIKLRIHALEDKLNAGDADKVQSEIDELRKSLDTLSDRLGVTDLSPSPQGD